jgi:hypothetical protein
MPVNVFTTIDDPSAVPSALSPTRTAPAHGYAESRGGYDGVRKDLAAAIAQACCRAVRNICCDVSAPRGTVFQLSAAPPPRLAIAYTS